MSTNVQSTENEKRNQKKTDTNEVNAKSVPQVLDTQCGGIFLSIIGSRVQFVFEQRRTAAAPALINSLPSGHRALAIVLMIIYFVCNR